MALKRLPNDVQSLLCASAQISNYKKAIEELIYNSLDAKSTSIAIRIHIQESTIQVIDNGSGIAKEDFKAIGHRYMTSKLTNLATLKAAPKHYGYRGEFIANIIMVSQMVKITSRHEKTEETWAKTFNSGKEKKFAQMTTRPTMGTTVDIKGFLYNLNIQKKGIDSMKEMQNIKSLLEQLSLVHNHISLSLRDDAQNEIIFKIHKKRDIYQTLSTLFNIDKLDVVELQVEKLEYKVKGYISKTDKDLDCHWIFLNGKFINYCSKLHKTVSDYFKKSLHIKDQKILKSKKNNDEHRLFNQNIPFYFIFITCPIIDYDISNAPKQSVIEFKNWVQIDKLLLKLVKFYAGDSNLKEIKIVEDKLMNGEQINTKVNQDTRDQVKKIMDKILGSHLKKIGASQLQNGIKGKTVKRKLKKKINRSAIIPKLFHQNANKNKDDRNALIKSKAEVIISDPNNEQQIIQAPVNDSNKKKKYKTLVDSRHRKEKNKIPDPKKFRTKEAPIRTKNREMIGQVSLVNNRNKATVKQKHKLKKPEKIKVNNNKFKYLEDLDSVCKLSKIVAQKADLFLQNEIKRGKNIIHLKNANRKDKENNMILQNKHCAINDAVLANTNKHIIEKYIMKKLKAKSYKTTYDLIETVLKSPLELNNAMENTMSEELYRHFYKPNETLRCVTTAPKRHAWTNEYICSEYTTNDRDKNEVSQYIDDISTQFKTCSEYKEKYSKYTSIYGQDEISDFLPHLSEKLQFINEEDMTYSQNQNIYCTQKETSYNELSVPLRVLTYDSHQYHKHEGFTKNGTKNFYTINKKQNLRFISKESRDNFVTYNDFKHKFKKPFRTVSNKQTKTFDTHIMRQTIDESYIIEYSKSYDKNYNVECNQKLLSSVNFNNDSNKSAITVSYEPVSSIKDLNPDFGNTYTVHSTYSNTNSITKIQSKELMHTYSINDYHSEVNEDVIGSRKTKHDFTNNSKNFNIVFVSKSQQRSEPSIHSCNINVEPLDVCETIFDEIGSGEREFDVTFNENNQLNDSLYGNIKDREEEEHVKNRRITINQGNDSVSDNISHHFSRAVKYIQSNSMHKVIDDNLQDPIVRTQNEKTDVAPENFPSLGWSVKSNLNMDCNFENNFNLKYRPRFVPKGMSQIFENCNNKTACAYDMDKDYYEDSIYNNFANDVQINSEIYEPIIQNVEDLTTKNIQKFQNKIKKDNASLVFDESSLKNAKVLGQADCKFIVAIMKKRSEQSKEESEYLILFDQHAVHERIRLEKNLADYLNHERWTSVAVDNIIMKMSKDELLYLHNYKDKFTQLGLQWTITKDCEVTIHSIPEAILGKNPREVEKVIKAVRNLIIEEIHIIKSQKGCVSLYPKSIMDLVFSESCRYAIKFGDQLSKRDCVKLVNDLSNCKTPFQCAHGRPVMAVIMDIIADKRTYKINTEALRRFKQRNTRK